MWSMIVSPRQTMGPRSMTLSKVPLNTVRVSALFRDPTDSGPIVEGMARWEKVSSESNKAIAATSLAFIAYESMDRVELS